MSTIDQDLREIDAIKQLKARYFRLMDTKQWDRWRSIFTDDCRFEGVFPEYPGPDEFCAGTRGRLDSATTIHHGHMPEIELTSDTAARGLWSMFDRVEFAEPVDLGRGLGHGWTGYGHYQEEYRKVDGEWKIAALRLTRLQFSPILEPRPLLEAGFLYSRESIDF